MFLNFFGVNQSVQLFIHLSGDKIIIKFMDLPITFITNYQFKIVDKKLYSLID